MAATDASIDPAAAFPTAAMVAHHRATDAADTMPMIGRNIGGGPDRLASTFAGNLRKEFCEELGSNNLGGAQTLVGRSMFYDELWMQALDLGCRQFVLLAAGLDARAWRMPHHDLSVKIFELDVPRCFAYKDEKLATLPKQLKTPCCTRIPVEVDLSDSTWGDQLVASGFDSTSMAFFLAEGLLMYLPPKGVPAFLAQVSALACPGSIFAGCCFIDVLSLQANSHYPVVFAKYGTKFTFETCNEAELRALLEAAQWETRQIASSTDTDTLIQKHKVLEDAEVSVSKDEAVPWGEVDDAKAQEHAKIVLSAVGGLEGWPKIMIKMAWESVQRSGYRSFAKELTRDTWGHMGIWKECLAQKTRILELVMDQGFESIARPLLEEAIKKQNAGASGYVCFFSKKRQRIAAL